MIFPILAAIVALSLCSIQISAFRKARDRRACIVPASVCLFAIFVFLVRGSVLPGILPRELSTIFSYFFSLYLTFSAAIAITSGQNRFKLASWILATVSAWILAIGN